MFLSCVFINFIFVFLTSGQYCNSGTQKRIHFRTDMEHHICRPVNNSDVSLEYQFCKNITFILYIIYNVRYTNTKYPMQSVSISSDVVGSNPTQGEVYNIIHLLTRYEGNNTFIVPKVPSIFPCNADEYNWYRGDNKSATTRISSL